MLYCRPSTIIIICSIIIDYAHAAAPRGRAHTAPETVVGDRTHVRASVYPSPPLPKRAVAAGETNKTGKNKTKIDARKVRDVFRFTRSMISLRPEDFRPVVVSCTLCENPRDACKERTENVYDSRRFRTSTEMANL